MSFLQEIQKNIIFSLVGRVSTTKSVPIYLRQSGTTIDKYIDDGLAVNSIPVFEPAIEPDGSIFIQPPRINECTYNLDLNFNEWIKGSSYNVQADLAIAPNGVNKGDRVSVALGTGSNNVLKRTFDLLPKTDYVVYQILQLKGGQFVEDDVLRVLGDVEATVETSYNVLNNYKDKYRIVELKFKTSGNIIDNQNFQPGNTSISPDLAIDPGLTTNIAVTAVTSSSITLEKVLSENDVLVGTYISFDNNPEVIYTITGNQKVGENNVVEVTPTTLIADGVTSSTRASLVGDPVASVTIETYISSAVTFDWGGMQIERGEFRTSPIFQGGQKIARSNTDFRFRKDDNPLNNLGTFSLMIDLNSWRGDGALLVSGDFFVEIIDGRLKINAGGVTLTDGNDLTDSPLIVIAVSADNSSLALYVDRKLVNRVGLTNYTVAEGSLDFRTPGFRSYQSFTVFNRIFADGQVQNGELIKDELETLLSNRGKDFLYTDNLFYGITLPPVQVDGLEAGGATAVVTSINVGAAEVTVSDGSDFSSTGLVVIQRTIEDVTIEITKTSIAGKAGNVLTLLSTDNIQTGDTITTQVFQRPGKASVRFPFSALETQEIESISTGNRKIALNTVAAFEEGMRVIIQSPRFQDLGEFQVEAVDPVNTEITLNSVTGLSVGDLITIPKSELLISGHLYTVEFLQDVPGVKVIQKGQNGFVLENTNSEKREVHTQIRSPI